MAKNTQRFPGFELGELLHESSSSAVYRAKRLSDGARVVAKCIQRGTASTRLKTRSRNEYELLSTLESDGVIAAYDLLAHEGRLALILEDFPGRPIKSWLEANPTLRERLTVAVKLAAAVGDVHDADIIHKDVNSHNVLYDPDTKRCKLIDFGLATRLRSEGSKFQMPAALEGTLAYIAPEQTGRMNRSVDYRADLYSLGVTLYELFSGELPHDSADPVEAVHFHIAGKPDALWQRASDVPEALSDVVMKLLQKAPEARYQSAAGLVADLGICLEQLDSLGAIEPFELGAKDLIDRFEPSQRLYGREEETSQLLATFRRVANGGVEAVLVAGQGGIGKSALVHEIHQPITERRGYFAAGKFDQFKRDVPFSAFVDALQELVEQLLTESEDAITAWRESIQAAVGANGQVIVDVIPSLELIIGRQAAVPELEPFEAQNRFNLVFQSFIQVFGKKAHPLVLFLDDMQWADQASLNLVSLVLAAPATESLLLVEAYRDNEVTATHPFMMAVQEQRKRGVSVASIELAPLRSADVTRIVADSLRVDAHSATPLAEIIEAKTLGNPFFIRQFLTTLHAEGLIRFDADAGTFRYDPEAIRSAAITENVAELMAAKLEKLPDGTRRVLRLAAAVGNRFSLDALSLIDDRPAWLVASELEPALRAGLIVPMSELESLDPESLAAPLVYRRFAFLHDRVQQAAYALIPEHERPALHLAIARVLQREGAGVADARLFDIVNHVNLGISLVDDVAERAELAKLLIRAGGKARRSTAYTLAVRCLENALGLLGDDAWSTQYADAYKACSRLAESLCLSADYERALEVIEEADARAASRLDRARLGTLKVTVNLSMGKIPEALACGREALKLFGANLPEGAAEIESMLKSEIAGILEKTSAIGIENLLDLPLMQDDEQMAIMESLTHCLPAAYQSDQQQYALMCCRMVSLSLEHGNCPISARAYGSFAALLSSVLGDYRDAYRFAKLGVDLAHRLDDASVLSGVYFLWAMFASHWNKPIDESIELYRKSVQYGLETGDHQHAAYSAARSISHQQLRGVPLAELREETTEALLLLRRIGDVANQEFLPPRLRLMDWLCGERPHGDTLDSETLDEAALTAEIEARGNRSFESDWFIMLMVHRYFLGDYEAALEFARKSETVLAFSAGFVTRAEHEFYQALTRAALSTAAQPEARAEHAAALAQSAERFATWAEHSPENYAAMYRLIEAERARLRGARLEAMDAYDEAIASAVDNGFVNIEALASELAARFWYDERKPDFGETYLEKALHAYEAWGALGKAADLRRTYRGESPVASKFQATSRASTRGSEQIDALDLATLLKSSRVISGEIVLERLLATLMDIIIENVGAESAALVLQSGDEYLIQGLKRADWDEAKVMLAEPLSQSVAVPKGIVNYVIRTAEHVVLDDPAERGRFRNDVYIGKRRPKSVLCVPVLHKGSLTGVIYLENNQVSGAFTPDRLEALNVLLAQIAVSIENATLYTSQERQSRTIEEANVALTKEVADRKRAEHELSRYKDHLEELVASRTAELEAAQGRLVDMSRRAGMAEVASGVLHNVGNVMNSVNVGASVAREAIKALRVEGVSSVGELFDRNAERLSDFLTADDTGKKIPLYLRKLGEELDTEKQSILGKIDDVLEHVEHMKKIVAAQQSYARTNSLTEVCSLEGIAETALAISQMPSNVEIVREYEALPSVLVDRHQILQILVNLVSNARHALRDGDGRDPRLTLRIASEHGGARIEVSDNGIGIPPENMPQVFNHGFTTKRDGHGFGLHNCANAAQAMGGSLTAASDGAGRGATFALCVPVEHAADAPAAEAPAAEAQA